MRYARLPAENLSRQINICTENREPNHKNVWLLKGHGFRKPPSYDLSSTTMPPTDWNWLLWWDEEDEMVMVAVRKGHTRILDQDRRTALSPEPAVL